MGIFDKMKNLIGIEDVEDDEISEEEIRRATSEKKQREENPHMPRTQMKEKVVPLGSVPMNAPQGGGKVGSKNTNPFKLMVIEPEGFEECPKFVDMLKLRKPVIINLENIDVDTARKTFDFMSGATYALNGTVQPVTNNIFVFAPESVDVTSQTPKGEEKMTFASNENKKLWR